MNEDLIEYYQQRALEYDRVYDIPAEQQDLAEATRRFQALFRGRRVLEIACGTGYWTQRIAVTAESIMGTDINEAVVNIARDKEMPDNVTLEIADMCNLPGDIQFDGLFGGFIWSHIPLQQLGSFLLKMGLHLRPGSPIAFIDSRQVEGGSHDRYSIRETDEHGNTFQTRRLENGTDHLVLKNFPAPAFLRNKLSSMAVNVSYAELQHYWIVTCFASPQNHH